VPVRVLPLEHSTRGVEAEVYGSAASPELDLSVIVGALVGGLPAIEGNIRDESTHRVILEPGPLTRGILEPGPAEESVKPLAPGVANWPSVLDGSSPETVPRLRSASGGHDRCESTLSVELVTRGCAGGCGRFSNQTE